MVQPLVVPWCSEVPWCIGAGCTTVQPKFYHGTTTTVLSFSTMVQPQLNHGTTTTVAWCNHWLYRGTSEVPWCFGAGCTTVQPQLYHGAIVPWCS